MVKHRRFSDNPNPESTQKEEKASTPEQEIVSSKTPKDFKTLLLSGTKYAYIIIAAALLSGIFTPLTIGAEILDVIFGMLSIFLGLGGGIVIFLGINKQKFTTLMVSAGLGIMCISFILICELAGHPLF
tara:strand:- start:464 stop:850 length:387 start_codon:yes stop_codon:yes gene_type:complete